MNRWTFIGGLTVTLLLLLVLSGFCFWATRGLTSEISTVIDRNYDGIRALRELCSSLNRLNAYYLAAEDVAGVPDTLEVFRHEHDIVERKLAQAMRAPGDANQREKLGRLRAQCQDYLDTMDELLEMKRRGRDRYHTLRGTLTGLTGNITNLSDQLVDIAEAAMMARRDAAIANGRRVTVIAVGFVVFSLGVYIFTSVRLTHALFEPLRRLRDSIQQVSDRRFDTLVPLEGGEELGQIATSFNRMAMELRRYLNETDERAVQSARLNRAILQALPYPVFLVDRDFQVRLANPRAETLCQALGIPGVLPGELRRQIDGAAGDESEVINDDLRRAIRLAPPSAPGEAGAAGADYLPQIFRMPAAFDGSDGWAVLLVDVTRFRRMDQAKTRALSTLGHEVKTPVAGMRMTLQLLLDGGPGPLSPTQRELVEAGRDDCERLLATLRALLELAQLESGQVPLALAPHPAAELLEEMHDAHVESLRLAGAELQFEVPPDLPDVLAEPLRALRVLDNFLTNARKYGVPGEPVVLRGRRRGDGFVRFSVVNRIRHALTEAEQARVFDPFFRRPGESADGTGLGLAISREIALAHGGRVGVFCPPDDGTVEFFLDLRAAPGRSLASTPPQSAEPAREAEQQAGVAQPAA